jgi:hypothetical protein
MEKIDFPISKPLFPSVKRVVKKGISTGLMLSMLYLGTAQAYASTAAIENSLESSTGSYEKADPNNGVKKKSKFPIWTIPLVLAAGAGIYFLTKKKSTPPTPPPVNNKATVTVLGYDGNPLTSGQVTTDAGTYSVGSGGVVNLEYKTSLDAKIASSGFIERNTRIENTKKYRMIPTEWDAFYSDPGVAGPTKGTNRFDGSVKIYIDGSTTDPDYNKAKARIAVVCGTTVPYTITTDAAQANFKIHLNYTENLHGETVSGKGMITDTNVYVVDNVSNGVMDTELGQGLTHIEGVKTAPPVSGDSAIVGSLSGWNEDIDGKIRDTVYNRSKSTFSNSGSEKENF